MTAVMAAAGMLGGAGLLLVIAGLRGRPDTEAPGRAWRPRWRTRWWTRSDQARTRLLGALSGALAGLVLTRWPVGALFGALAGIGLPVLLGAGGARQRALDRLEAIATWTEMLRDLMSAASGLEEAIIASARSEVVPAPIRAEVGRLAAGLANRQPFHAALQAFTDALADPAADRVAVVLALARDQQARQLTDLLGALAASTREQVAARLRVETERVKPRASARMIALISLVVLVVLLVGSRDWLAPYATPVGQLAATAIGGLFAGAFLLMHRMQRDPPPRRLRVASATITPAPTTSTAGTARAAKAAGAGVPPGPGGRMR